ncbi:MAG: hypothetical protein BIFFINMI_02433 [Phycisphaerae bacterium]|nr:hypothetical protein [Phycisphaerae bacterium]
MSDSEQDVRRLHELVTQCVLCPQGCEVDRSAGELGNCRTGADAVVASSGPHFGEEPCLVGTGGSGTIFFSGCSLSCAFCQNHDISQQITGRELTPIGLADLALRLAEAGCENVNFVTPTHIAHVVAEAIRIARQRGLKIPVVYNCGGYESVPTLRMLEGLVQIYMPDFKYGDAYTARRYSHAEDYPAVAQAAVAEMFRQVGQLRLDERGVAVGGLLVRHLVLPNDLAASRLVIEAVAAAAPGATINIMGQYHPDFRAAGHSELMDRVDPAEVKALRDYAARRGLLLVGPNVQPRP